MSALVRVRRGLGRRRSRTFSPAPHGERGADMASAAEIQMKLSRVLEEFGDDREVLLALLFEFAAQLSKLDQPDRDWHMLKLQEGIPRLAGYADSLADKFVTKH